ncbi:MAG: PhzF family phenazine biosynthesis protein [Rhodothermaceae bacterium]|nr:PhzF family phenazine biosynthesis protein [Rhodothermaceae bacterium]
MPRYPFMQVDAFTDRPLGGNPCAIVFDADDLDTDTMQAIAREMNLSETAFVMRSDHADFGVRYFTPAEEIPLAGHPTIATTFALVETGRQTLNGATTQITLDMPAGVIPVTITAKNGAVASVVMDQKAPVFGPTFGAETVLPLFGLDAADVLPEAASQIVSTGTPQLMIPLRMRDALRRVQVDLPAFTAFREQHDFFSAHLFALEGATSDGDTFARHFASPPDVFEDPFTGSATGGMGAYLWHHALIETPSFIAEQGHWMHRPGRATVEAVGPRDAIETVRVGGAAAAIVEGTLMF